MSDVSVVKALLSYPVYLKYHALLLKIPNLAREIKTVIVAIGKYYKRYGGESIKIDDIQRFYFYMNPQPQNPEMIQTLFDQMRIINLDSQLIGDLLNQVVERHSVTEISLLCDKMLNNITPTVMHSIREKISEFDSLIAMSEEENRCKLTVFDLFTEEYNDGLKWRHPFLQNVLKNLRPKFLGHIFGRPDSGKTALALSEAVFMARQVTEANPIMFCTNEESIDRSAKRAMCSLLKATEKDVSAKKEKAHRIWLETKCDQIVFLDSVLYMWQIEKYLESYHPRVLFVDQGPKIAIPGKDEGATRLQKLYNLYRELAKHHNCSIITLGQADSKSANKKYLGMERIDQSKTGVPGELDWILGIGYVEEPGWEAVRWFNICKNKMGAEHGNTDVVFDSQRCTFK